MISILFILFFKSDSFAYKKKNLFQYAGSNEKRPLNDKAQINDVPFNKEYRFNNEEQKIKKTKNIPLILGINIACLIMVVVIIIAIAACCKKGVSNSNIGIMTDPKF